MHSKDMKEFSISVTFTKVLKKEIGLLQGKFRTRVRNLFGKNVVACIEQDNYGKDRYRFIVKFPKPEKFPKQTEQALSYLVKLAITDVKIHVLQNDASKYAVFASRYKIINN